MLCWVGEGAAAKAVELNRKQMYNQRNISINPILTEVFCSFVSESKLTLSGYKYLLTIVPFGNTIYLIKMLYYVLHSVFYSGDGKPEKQ